jgi:hypothetical protein
MKEVLVSTATVLPSVKLICKRDMFLEKNISKENIFRSELCKWMLMMCCQLRFWVQEEERD